MIFFLHKTTGKIIGMIHGRAHPQEVLENSWMQPNDIPSEEIEKIIVPTEEVFEEVEEPIIEMFVEGAKVVRKVVGVQTIRRAKELRFIGEFAELAYMAENGTLDLQNTTVQRTTEEGTPLDNN